MGWGLMKDEDTQPRASLLGVKLKDRWGVCTMVFLNLGYFRISFSSFGLLGLGYLFQCEMRELLRLKIVSEEN